MENFFYYFIFSINFTIEGVWSKIFSTLIVCLNSFSKPRRSLKPHQLSTKSTSNEQLTYWEGNHPSRLSRGSVRWVYAFGTESNRIDSRINNIKAISKWKLLFRWILRHLMWHESHPTNINTTRCDSSRPTWSEDSSRACEELTRPTWRRES